MSDFWAVPTPPIGTCRGCGERFLLHDGLVAGHVALAHITSQCKVDDCAGSDKSPLEDDLTEEDMAYLHKSLGLETEHSDQTAPPRNSHHPEEG